MALSSGGKAVIIAGFDGESGDDDLFYFVYDVLVAYVGQIEADDVTLVGTLTTFDVDTLVDANILSGA